MGYKFKPNKSVMSRFKVSATGKLKRHHAKTSHLLSVRTGNTKRKLGRSAILSESMAPRMRKLIGKKGLNPNRIAHERAVAAAQAKSGTCDCSCSCEGEKK
jgi:large subunit ribosomal protein L35